MADVTISGLSQGVPDKGSAIIPYSDGSTTYKTSPSGIVAASPGSIIQVKHTLFTQRFNMSSNQYTPVLGLNTSITPTALTSKILVQTSIIMAAESWNPGAPYIGLNRSSDAPSSVRTYQRPNNWAGSSGDTNKNPFNVALTLYENVDTLSTITYQFVVASAAQGYNTSVNTYADGSNENIGYSNMTVWEIAG